jgi:hypothetical protein
MVAGEGEEESHAEIPIEGRVFDRETNRGAGDFEEGRVEMSEMVERVARAIYKASCDEAYDGERYIPAWDRMNASSKEVYLGFARAAIAAMREPTAAMVITGSNGNYPDDIAAIWQDMIDEALR